MSPLRRLPLFILFGLLPISQLNRAAADEAIAWRSDYATAFNEAKTQQKMLLIYFEGELDSPAHKTFEATLSDAQVQQLCQQYVALRIPTSYEVKVGDESMPLLNHDAFGAMQNQPGLAVIDFKNSECESYGHTVSTVPFQHRVYFAPEFAGVKSVRTLLDLPAGTITQRMMIYAVRLHPENPASTRGRAEPVLLSECAGHCAYQASIGVQGHQGFDSRFHRINARIGGNAASEVVAESWSGEGLVAACFSCVHSWRGSPGHWSSVSGTHNAYGYDIKRSRSGTWYATGIFGG